MPEARPEPETEPEAESELEMELEARPYVILALEFQFFTPRYVAGFSP